MKNIDLVIENAHVLCMNHNYTDIPNGNIAIKDGEIIAIYPTDQPHDFEARKTINAKGQIALPGLINTHTHAAMTIYRGLGDDKNLMEWLQKYIWPAEAEFGTEENVKVGTQLAMMEMIKSGTTTFSDMYFFQDAVAQLAKDHQMRVVLGEGILNFPTPSIQDPENSFQVVEDLIKKWEGDNLVSFAITPHAPYTVSRERLIRAKDLANKYDLPFHIHLSETAFEVQESIDKEGKSPVQYLDEIGVLDQRTIAAHCVHFDEKDIQTFADRGCSVSHNPQSNLKLGSGIAPIHDFLSNGIKVSIGTDGVASNNTLNLFKDVDLAAKLQKGIHQDASVVNAKTALSMVTKMAAETLGMDDKIGSIEIGKRADIILFDTNHINVTPLYDPYSHLIYASNGNEISTSIIDGKVVMENYELTTFNENEVINKVNQLAQEIRSKLF